MVPDGNLTVDEPPTVALERSPRPCDELERQLLYERIETLERQLRRERRRRRQLVEQYERLVREQQRERQRRADRDAEGGLLDRLR